MTQKQPIRFEPVNYFYKKEAYYMTTKYEVGDTLLTYDELPPEMKTILDNLLIRT